MGLTSMFVRPDAQGFSTNPASLDAFPSNPIGPRRAIGLAQPHVEASHALRRANGLGQDFLDRPEMIVITLRGDFYLVVKENYPAKDQAFYEKFAVKVHKDTGEVTPPTPPKNV